MQNKTYSAGTQPFRQSPQPQRLFSMPTSTARYVCKMASVTHADLFKQPMNEQQLEQAPHSIDNNCDNENNNNNGNKIFRRTPP